MFSRSLWARIPVRNFRSTAAIRSRSGGRLTADFPMTEDLVLSREHFQIENKPPLCHLIDLGSTNGTKVNGLRVEQVHLPRRRRDHGRRQRVPRPFPRRFARTPRISPRALAAAGGSRSGRKNHDTISEIVLSAGQAERLALRRLPGPPAQVPQDRTPTT